MGNNDHFFIPIMLKQIVRLVALSSVAVAAPAFAQNYPVETQAHQDWSLVNMELRALRRVAIEQPKRISAAIDRQIMGIHSSIDTQTDQEKLYQAEMLKRFDTVLNLFHWTIGVLALIFIQFFLFCGVILNSFRHNKKLDVLSATNITNPNAEIDIERSTPLDAPMSSNEPLVEQTAPADIVQRESESNAYVKRTHSVDIEDYALQTYLDSNINTFMR